MGDAAAKPTWLMILFGLQSVGWLTQSGCGCFFTLFASQYPEGPRLAFLVTQTLLALGAALVFFFGATRPIQTTALQRAARVHSLAGVLTTVPFVLLSFASGYGQASGGETGSALGSVGMSLASFAIVIGAAFASRSTERGWQIFGLVVGMLWLLAAALFMLGAGVGMAGITA